MAGKNACPTVGKAVVLEARVPSPPIELPAAQRLGLSFSMNTALFLLMRLQARAAVRRAFRSARTAKGIIFVIIGVLILIPWMGSVFVSARFATPTDPA